MFQLLAAGVVCKMFVETVPRRFSTHPRRLAWALELIQNVSARVKQQHHC
jgi:hypothetical protein